jgi:hypothetical protein
MPYLNIQGQHPKIGQSFNAMLDDTGSRTCLPVTAELTSNHWIKIGSDDFRKVLSCRSENGVISLRAGGCGGARLSPKPRSGS